MQNMSEFTRIAIAMVIMLLFAGAEYVGAQVTGLFTLAADAVNMLGHTSIMLIALTAALITKIWGDPKRRFEAIGGMINALFLISLGSTTFFGGMAHSHLHNHNMICGGAGYILTLFAVASFVVHAITAWLLHKGGRTNVNVMGIALYISAHTLMVALMFIGGLLIEWFGWLFIDIVIMYLIVIFMLVAGIKIAYDSTILWLSN